MELSFPMYVDQALSSSTIANQCRIGGSFNLELNCLGMVICRAPL